MKKIFAVSLILTSYILFPPSVSAHAFGAMYTLPIPFWLYSFAAAAALLLSFLLIGFFITKHDRAKTFPNKRIDSFRPVSLLTGKIAVRFYQFLSLFLFLLTILTGLIGEDIAAFNFNMTFFWVIFVLGFTYLSLLFGNIWEVVNPWKVLVSMYENITKRKIRGLFRYPEQFGYYPAFIFYIIFIIIELFTGGLRRFRSRYFYCSIQ